MTTFAISMCKDERDVIEHTLRRTADQVDEILVADNGSTDGTRDILDQLAGELPLTVIDDPDPAYYQSQKMTRLALEAADAGATWVLPVDADEVWYSPFGRIADVLAEHPHAAVARATLYDHVPTAEDPDDPDPVARIGWRRREAAPLFKVACRPLLPVTIHQGNHSAEHPTATIGDLLVVRHFPYRSVEQFVSKVRNGAAAYAATDLPHEQGAHWREYGQLLEARGPAAIDEIFHTWFWSASPASDPTLIRDPWP